MTSKTVPPSEHFNFHELAEGVWAAIVKPTGLAASNSGIVDLGGRTLVFDTTLSPASAADLRAAAEHLTGQPVAGVLTSHGDHDHVFGNAAFSPETELYATARTRELMLEQTPADIAEFKQKWPALQQQWIAGAQTAKDEVEKLDFEDGVRFAQRVIDAFPQLAAQGPTPFAFTFRVRFPADEAFVRMIDWSSFAPCPAG